MRSDLRRKSILGACCGAHAAQDGLVATLYVLIPVLAETLGLSYAQVGVIRATKSAASSLLELPSGLLAERLGERSLLVFGLASAGLGYFWLSTAEGIGIVLASLFVVGVGGAFQHALSSAVVSQAYDADGRRSALGLYNSSGDAGKLIFTALFSVLVGVGFAWQGIVVLFGGLALVVGVYVLVVLRRASAGAPGVISSGPAHPARSIGWGIDDRVGFSALCSAIFLDSAVQSSFLVFLAFLIAEKGVATEWAAFAVVLTLVGGMFGKAGCGFLAQRLGVRLSFACVQMATALAIAAVVVVPSVTAFVLLPLLGMFLQGSSTITYGAVGDYVHSERQSRGFGLIYSVGSIASVSGPVLFGVVGDRHGLVGAMVAMALASLAAIAPGFFLGSKD